jgi:hypothetical protein
VTICAVAVWFLASAAAISLYHWAQTGQSLADVLRDAAAAGLLALGFGCSRKEDK